MSASGFRFIFYTISCFLTIGNIVSGQQPDTLVTGSGFRYQNSIYIELLGPGGLYSAGYEGILLNHDQFKTSMQTGFAWYPPVKGALKLTVPLSINEILSFNSNHIKIGAGSTFLLKRQEEDGSSVEFLAHLGFGYRYQEKNARFYWEATLISFMEGGTTAFELGSVTSHLWAGVSCGYMFNIRK